MAVDMRKYPEFVPNAPFHDPEAGDYGFIKSHPYTDGDGDTVVDIEVVDQGSSYFDIDAPMFLTITSGCECGNPWVKCHPEA